MFNTGARKKEPRYSSERRTQSLVGGRATVPPLQSSQMVIQGSNMEDNVMMTSPSGEFSVLGKKVVSPREYRGALITERGPLQKNFNDLLDQIDNAIADQLAGVQNEADLAQLEEQLKRSMRILLGQQQLIEQCFVPTQEEPEDKEKGYTSLIFDNFARAKTRVREIGNLDEVKDDVRVSDPIPSHERPKKDNKREVKPLTKSNLAKQEMLDWTADEAVMVFPQEEPSKARSLITSTRKKSIHNDHISPHDSASEMGMCVMHAAHYRSPLNFQ